ncbi:Peptidase A1 domain-containing protein [Mycena kentingensis (nom. inval.)]|nr:Peptidase A1 domain-containing protein [Mycena kentingensis (nom. inval.)]
MSSLSIILLTLLASVHALPASKRFQARNAYDNYLMKRAEPAAGSVTGRVGLGDNSDLLYTVPISLGDTTTVVNLGLSTGSSDLWVITTNCQTNACAKSRATHIPERSLTKTGANVTMRYGDSTTGTYATGNVAMDTVAIAGVAIDNQMFAAIEDTTNTVVQFGAAGIFGLSFPSESQIQGAAVRHQFGSQQTTDRFIAASYADGPLISRIAQTNALEMPMFAIELQRSTIDISGKGELTLGELPEGVDNSTITWVPVRLYTPEEGGLNAPTFAPDELYPLRWEIEIDGVFLDGKQLPASTIPATGGVSSTRMSALVDTGNSILRGPQDVVDNILGTISPNYSPAQSNSALLACASAHNLAYQIGGKARDVPHRPARPHWSRLPRRLHLCPRQPRLDRRSRLRRDLPLEFGCPVLPVASTSSSSTTATSHIPRKTLRAWASSRASRPMPTSCSCKPSTTPSRMAVISIAPTLVLAPTAEADALPEVTVVPIAGSVQAAGLTALPTSTPVPDAPVQTQTTNVVVNAPAASASAVGKGAALPARGSWSVVGAAAAVVVGVVVVGW